MLSGLLSLNVHEPLTFEGTEICLHPDIFQQNSLVGGEASPIIASNSRQSSIGSGTNNSNIPGNSSVASTAFRGSGLNRAPSFHSQPDDKSTIPPPAPGENAGSPLQQDSRLLQVGDMIEIRVWDPLPGVQSQQRGGIKGNPASAALTLRKRYHHPQSPNPTSTSVYSSITITASTAGNLPSPVSLNDKKHSSTQKPKQNSDRPEKSDSQAALGERPAQPDPNGPPGIQEDPRTPQMSPRHSPSASPTVTPDAAVTATLGRPPIAPRGRSVPQTVGNPSVSAAAKSAAVPRRRTEVSVDQQHTGTIHHSRDISDISADTTVLCNLGDNESQLPSTDNKSFTLIGSHSEDEENDMWTEVSSTHSLRLSFVMLVTEKSLKSLKASSRTHVSILRQVADLYQLSTYDMITVHKLVGQEAEKALQAVSADFVVVTIKDQYLSRGELHFFQNSLVGSWIYEGQRLFEPTRGIHANAREIRHGGAHASSGIVTDSTTIAFRSRSSRIFWLVQMSAEMWDFASPFHASNNKNDKESTCEIYFDKFISFVYDLFKKWKQAEVTHSLTVVFFSRTFVTHAPGGRPDPGIHTQTDIYGRHYEDHCRKVIENVTTADWDSLILRIKEAFQSYPDEVGWNLATGPGARRPSTAGQGNLLETVNVTLNLLQYHYLDRDLHRTGNSIVIVSAGNGVFEVDKKLAMITYQRMMDNGIGSDMLSLGLPPLHISPFFLYFNEFQEVESDIPHWIHLSFISYESDENLVALNDTRVEEPEQGTPVGAIQEPILDIGPNGFLRSRANVTDISPAFEADPEAAKKAFSPRGNAAASPAGKRKVSSENNEDRDFRDILEACRPRAAGALPRALKSLLKMYAAGKKEKSSAAQLEPDGDDIAIKEWDEVNLNEVNRGKPVRLVGDHSSPLLMSVSPPRIDEFDLLESSSPQASSFTSQIPHPLFGTSYERHFFVPDTSTMINDAKMQRAPSLEFNLGQEDQLGSEPQGGEKEDVSFLDLMRRQLEKHDKDKMLPGPKSPNAGAKAELDRSSVHGGQGLTPSRTHTQIFGSSSRGQAATIGRDRLIQVHENSASCLPAGSGGIGAALSHYSGSSGSTDLSEAHKTIQRTSSAGHIAGAPLLRISESSPRGLSPLILPPPRGLNISHRDGPFGPGLSSRFIRPADPSRHTVLGSGLVAGEGLSTSPESRIVRLRSRVGSGGNQREMESAIRRPSSPGSDSKTKRLGQASPSPEARVARARQRNPPEGQQIMVRPRPLSSQTRVMPKDPPSTLSSGKHGTTARRRKPINPFRQQDEFEVLAQKSHNSRRWSHVFPQGEIEFKRKSGPNWKSLSAPAILPLTIDYFPPQREREHNFTFSLYNVTLSEFERNNFSSNKELLWEMVRQRITQDYQFVPASFVDDRDLNRRSLVRRDRGEGNGDTAPNAVRMYLSIGHRLQVLHYDPTSDTVEVKTYIAKNAQGKNVGTFKYFYQSYCHETGEFVRVGQDFRQFTLPYSWNKVDRIICGDEDREMREGMRFKRVQFAILPEKFSTIESEIAYKEKFKKLLEYFEKLREKEDTNRPLAVKIETSQDVTPGIVRRPDLSKPGIAGSSMVRFYVPFRKGGRELFEYLEVSIDSTFNTSWSYRIIFNWFVASSGKVEAQVQLLQRRCLQFGLQIIPSLELSVSRTLFLDPFKVPAIFTIKDGKNVAVLEAKLSELDFIYDGIFLTSRDFVDCIEGGAEFDFGKKWGKLPAGHQFIHRTGALFVRIVEDKNGKAVVFAFKNSRYALKDSSVHEKCAKIFEQLNRFMEDLVR